MGGGVAGARAGRSLRTTTADEQARRRNESARKPDRGQQRDEQSGEREQEGEHPDQGEDDNQQRKRQKEERWTGYEDERELRGPLGGQRAGARAFCRSGRFGDDHAATLAPHRRAHIWTSPQSNP